MQPSAATDHRTATVPRDHNAGTNPATAGTDYDSVAGTLTIAPNQRTATITVQTLPDANHEPPETLELQLTAVTNATIGTGTAIGTINDTLPTLTISGAPAADGGGGGGGGVGTGGGTGTGGGGATGAVEGSAVVFTINSDVTLGTDLTVAIQLRNGLGTDGFTSNFLPATVPDTATIPQGSQQVALSITTVDDQTDEADGTVTARLQPTPG